MVKEKQARTQVAATCEFPSVLQGKSITSLNDTEFECKGLPEITEEPSDVDVHFGGTAYFTCKVDGDPQPEVIWLHNNEVISDNPRVSVLTDGTLMIANTQGHDMGFYECRATNDMGDVYSRKAKILMSDAAVPTRSEPVGSRPRFVRLPLDTNVTKGSPVELQCKAYGIPKPDITWTKDNIPVAPGGRIQIEDGGTLFIAESEGSDSGLYRCHSANHLGRVTATAKIQVLIFPRFSTEPKDTYNSEGSTAIFSCEADGEPSPVITWYRNDVLILPSGRFNIFVGGNRLRIQDVKRFDEGEFVCKATNEAGTAETEASLYVRDKLAPIIKSEPRDVTVQRGQDMAMLCHAQGLPAPAITWRKDGHHMTNTLKHRVESDGSLHVFNVSSSDQGIYECSATNYVGYASARATLTVTAEPVIHLGDAFLEESFEEARNKVNKAYNDTISKLFSTSRTRAPNPHELLRIFRFPQAQGREIARVAETIEQTLEIVQRRVEEGLMFNLSGKFTYEDLLSLPKLRTLADLSGCLVHRRPISTCDEMCFNLKYRTLDGTCNNLNKPMWGASLTGFKREMPPIYENGFNTPVGWSQTKKYFGYFKPSARVVSTRLLSTENISPDSHCTHMLMQWGQFLDHDIDHALPAISTESFRTGVPCQTSCDYSAPCFPIEIPTDDPRVRHRCMEFTRSSAVCGSGESSVFFDKLLQREQINQLTSFIDGSQIYSSSNPELRALRNLTYPYGQLRGGIKGYTGKLLLPFSNGLPIDCRRDHTESAIDCFLAGDVRANEHVGLLSMHTLWFREHNRISDELRLWNPHWDGDTLFHEARKVLGATIQHITFNHWLPHILGPGGMEKLGPYTGYDPQVDPTISNVFATAAFRFGHTLINPELQRLNSTFQPIPKGHLPLHKAFFSPWRIVEEGGIDPILRGLLATPAKSKVSGQFLNTELTEKLFRAAHEIALDLAAINIQRGRDHAIQSYVDWRRFCNLSVPETFNDLSHAIKSKEIRTKLRQLYGHPGNVDLFVGGLLEDPIDGGRVGPTVSCLLIRQFKNLRDGDRFWYENPWVFKPEQLDQIKQATLARVMCNNGDNITDVTRDVFVLPQEQTPAFVPCSIIPKIDLRLWSDCCKDCKNAGFFASLSRPSTQRFRREAQFSYKDDRSHYLTPFEEVLGSNNIGPRNNSFSKTTEWNSISNSILNPREPSPLPQRRNDRFLSDIFDSPPEHSSSPDTAPEPPKETHNDPLEGYVKDVNEERIEGVEALVEQLSNTVEQLMRKIRRLEKLHPSEGKPARRKTCTDEDGATRKRGDTWKKGDCVKCVCRPKGVRCRVISCPEVDCENPVKQQGNCCPKCN